MIESIKIELSNVIPAGEAIETIQDTLLDYYGFVCEIALLSATDAINTFRISSANGCMAFYAVGQITGGMMLLRF